MHKKCRVHLQTETDAQQVVISQQKVLETILHHSNRWNKHVHMLKRIQVRMIFWQEMAKREIGFKILREFCSKDIWLHRLIAPGRANEIQSTRLVPTSGCVRFFFSLDMISTDWQRWKEERHDNLTITWKNKVDCGVTSSLAARECHIQKHWQHQKKVSEFGTSSTCREDAPQTSEAKSSTRCRDESWWNCRN